MQQAEKDRMLAEQKLAYEAELERQKIAAQAAMEQDRQRFEADQKERDRLLQLTIAEMNKAKEIELAQMKEMAAAQARSETMLGNEQANKVEQILQAVQQMWQTINAPREVVRDNTGKAVGVSIGGNVRKVVRGPDGRITGLQ
jgi:hypothetical protein